MFQLLLATTVIIGVLSHHLEVKWNNVESPVSPWGSPAIQFLTPGDAIVPSGLFYDVEDEYLTYVDKSGDLEYNVDLESGDYENEVIFDSAGQGFAFNYPILNGSGKSIIGSGNAIIEALYFPAITSNYVKLDPVPVTNDTGYAIAKGHADKNGNLFLALNSKTDKKNRGGRLYKLNGHVPVLVKQFTGDVMGFAWDYNYTSMYLIIDCGKTIVQYNYDITKQTISNEKVVFKLPSGPNEFTEKDVMTGVETNDLGCLWVTVSGCGKLVEINNGKIKQILNLPVKSLTGLTAGGKDNKGLIVSTSKLCEDDVAMSGGILYVSGINGTGSTDNAPKW